MRQMVDVQERWVRNFVCTYMCGCTCGGVFAFSPLRACVRVLVVRVYLCACVRIIFIDKYAFVCNA